MAPTVFSLFGRRPAAPTGAAAGRAGHPAAQLVRLAGALALTLPLWLAPLGARAQAPTWQAAIAPTQAGSGASANNATAVNAAGDIFITGTFTGQVAFGNTLLLNAGGTSSGTIDVYLAKWSAATGQWAWAISAGGTGNDRATALVVSGNSIYLTGSYTNGPFNENFAVFGGTTLLGQQSSSSDVFLAKYTDTGTSASLAWVTSGGGTGADQGNGLAVSGNSVYVAGSFTGNAANTTAAAFGTTALAGSGTGANTDVFVARYTDSGTAPTLDWVTGDGGTSNDDALGLAVSGTNVYVTGSFTNGQTNSAQVLFGSLPLAGRAFSGIDAFVVKYTDTGTGATADWVASGGGSSADQGNGIAVSGTNVYVTGSFLNTAADGNAVRFGTNTPLAGSGTSLNSDVFVARYTDAGTSGTFDWVNAAGGTGTDEGRAIVANGAGVYVTGSFTNPPSNANAATFGGTTLTGVNGQDVFVARYADTGTGLSLNWATAGGGNGATDRGNAVVVSATQVVVGFSVAAAPASFGAFGPLTTNHAAWARLVPATGAVMDARSALAPGTSSAIGTALNAAGDRYVVGNFSGQAQFGSTVLTSAGSTDFYVAKWSATTNQWVWAISGGGTSIDNVTGIQVAGNAVYLTGFYRNGAGNSEAAAILGTPLPGSGAASTVHLFLVKLTDGGAAPTVTWAEVSNGQGSETSLALAVQGSAVYIAGSVFNNAANVNLVTLGGVPLAGAQSALGTDAFVAKYTDAGSSATCNWAVAGGGSGTDQGRAIGVRGTAVYLGVQASASSAAAVTFGGITRFGSGTTANNDVFLVKYTDVGTGATAEWVERGGGTGADVINSLATGSGGAVYIGGAYVNTAANANAVTFGGTPAAGFGATTTNDLYVAKYVDAGTSASLGWLKTGGGDSQDQVIALAVSGLAVYATGNATFNNNTVVLDGTPLSGVSTTSGFDVFVARFTDAGPSASLAWALTGGGSGTDVGAGLAAGGGKVAVGGSIAAPATFGAVTLPVGTTTAFAASLTDLVPATPAPTLTNLSPSTAPVGTSITLSGTDFTGATVFSFNGTPATTFSVTSATTATATVPVGATSGNVTITTPGGTSNGLPFTVGLADLVVSTVVSVPQSASYNNITILAGGQLTTGNLNVSGQLVIQDGGEIRIGGIVVGSGSVELQAGGKLRVTAVRSLYPGFIDVTGSVSLSSDAVYEFASTSRGTFTISGGLPATVRELIITAVQPISLGQPVAVSRVLRLNSGTLNTNGNLTLLSTATRQAYVVHNGGTTSGTVTVQRYVGGPTAAGYRHLSSPVQATNVSDLATTGFTPNVNAAYNNLPYVAPPLNQFPNVLGFDETRGGTASAYAGFAVGYYSPTALTDALTSGRGWSVYIPGGKTPDFVGTLTTGNVAHSLTVTGTNPSPNTRKAGWHLLGNPYPQPIDWDLATVPTGMDAAISVYRTTGGNNGAYLTRANGIGSLPDGVLPVGQAFFARATTATNFTFTNALRVEANPGPVARPTAETRPVLSLRLTDPRNGTADETFVYVEAGATTGEDARFDGLKPGRNAGVPTLATLIAGASEAAVNGLPESVLTEPTTVELTAVLPTTGTYTLAVGQFSNFGGTEVELLDRLTGTRYDLTQHPAITISASRADEVVTGRFAVVLQGQRVKGGGTAVGLTLWPNPAHGTVRVSGAAGTVTLLDATGRVLLRAAPGTDTLDLTSLPAGVYVVRCGAQTKRLVVE